MNEDKENTTIGIAVEQISVENPFGGEPDLGSLLVLPTRNLVLFPGVTISISLKRQLSIDTATEAYENKQPIAIVCQRNADDDKPTISKGLHKYGVIGNVIKILELPDDEKTAIVHGREPIKLLGAGSKSGHHAGTIVARAEMLADIVPEQDDKDMEAIIDNIATLLKKILPAFGVEHVARMMPTLLDQENPEQFVNTMVTNMPMDDAEKIEMLKDRDLKSRAMRFLSVLTVKEQEMDLSMGILNQARTELDDDQKRMFLQRQMDVIHEQLYGETDDASRLEQQAKDMPLSAQAREALDRELNKLRHTNPNNPDYFVTLNYIETLLALPWGKASAIDCDFSRARQELEKDHCGLEKVKERVLEQMAVIVHNPEGKAPILCLVGPPGVGKTSLGKSIAAALGREYQRVSLGGMHDEAEIRGHRRTYVAAMPGRIIDAVSRAGVTNPVLVLDEIDKIGADYKGDPSAALLEVLDPEQNCKFHDNFIDVDFDLSRVLFIATANTSSTIAKPLLDRMEIINLSGYLAEEKMEIARKHLLRRTFETLAIEPGEFEVSDAALRAIIDTYTSESGVRQLEKALSTIARKYLLAKLSGGEFPSIVEPEHLKDLLGLAPYIKDKYEGNDFAGVACGLAWTEVGGEIILAEASLSKGKGEMTVTGNLGLVMKESASLAFQWVKAHAVQLGIDQELFTKYNLHIHFPEGAIPKDGPSAGITIATAIVSAFTQRRVRKGIAMTGEITLRGKVLPVGGIKEKILAAKRAGISRIILCDDNRRDIEDIDPKYIDGLAFDYVRTASDVMAIAITDEPASDALPLT